MKRIVFLIVITILTALQISAVFLFELPKNAIAEKGYELVFVYGKKKLTADLSKDFIGDRGNSVAEKVSIIGEVRALGFNAEISLNYVFPSLAKYVHKIEKELKKPPVSASVQMHGQKGGAVFVITSEEWGERVNTESLYSLVFICIKEGKKEIKVPIERVKPMLTRSELEQDTHERSGFSTYCNKNNYPRTHNIRLALNAVNGCVVPPNGVFSFNKTVGLRKSERGYMNSAIIYKGEYVEGVGGGVCQVSTTLYNAVLLADLPVIERNRHTLKSNYIEAGFDAMVTDEGADLRFKNNTGGYLYLFAEYDNGKVTVKIYGRENMYEIDRESKVLEEYKKGSLLSESYLIYRVENEVVKKFKIHRDYYYPNPHYVE